MQYMTVGHSLFYYVLLIISMLYYTVYMTKVIISTWKDTPLVLGPQVQCLCLRCSKLYSPKIWATFLSNQKTITISLCIHQWSVLSINFKDFQHCLRSSCVLFACPFSGRAGKLYTVYLEIHGTYFSWFSWLKI